MYSFYIMSYLTILRSPLVTSLQEALLLATSIAEYEEKKSLTKAEKRFQILVYFTAISNERFFSQEN